AHGGYCARRYRQRRRRHRFAGSVDVSGRCARAHVHAVGNLGSASGRTMSVSDRCNMVTPWTDDDRRELAELCRIHDRMMAEAASERMRRPPVSESDPDGLIYKDYDNSAPAPAPEADPWAGWNAWLRGHLDIERQSIREEVENALVELIVLL